MGEAASFVLILVFYWTAFVFLLIFNLKHLYNLALSHSPSFIGRYFLNIYLLHIKLNI